MKFGLALKQKAIALKLNRHPILGCSDEQILKVMRVQNVKRLPEIYRQYLKVMGRASEDIYLGTDVTFDYLLKLKTCAKSLLLEDKRTFLLPEDAFVFLMHQGYQFLYFYTNNDEDNPSIFR